MKLSKLSNYVNNEKSKENYLKSADTDLINIFNAFKGRIRFGASTNGYRGENIEGEYRTYTASTTAGTAVVHTLKVAPTGFLVVQKTGWGDLFWSSANSANVTFVSSTTAVTYTVFLMK
jgi:hypothetical protein